MSEKNELPIGIYTIPNKCRAVVLEGGRKVEIRMKKNLPLEPKEHRCCHCKHYTTGHTGYYLWTTTICDKKPKQSSKEMTRRAEINPKYKDMKLFYHAYRYGKPCELFERKEE